ncbi:MAG: hypothetical protein IPP21_08920 [Betaproteobacteria bacterium]|nr:hypothetical protein [Betaproteobacteria bacterium]
MRYGKSVDSGLAEVDISARQQGKKVLLRIRIMGRAPPEQVRQLITPFFAVTAGAPPPTAPVWGWRLLSRLRHARWRFSVEQRPQWRFMR